MHSADRFEPASALHRHWRARQSGHLSKADERRAPTVPNRSALSADPSS